MKTRRRFQLLRYRQRHEGGGCGFEEVEKIENVLRKGEGAEERSKERSEIKLRRRVEKTKVMLTRCEANTRLAQIPAVD